jgi:uncharacterized protein (DUF1800 family)
MVERDPDRARAAHLLRRTSLAVDTERIDELAPSSWEDAVAEVLAAAGGDDESEPPETEEWVELVAWWVDRMASPGSGLRDRMAWFWHGLLTTSAEKVSTTGLVRQQLMDLRAGALGDYRSLLHTFVTGGALLEFLDASWSLAANPNENLARELLELFSVGQGAYSEDDVRAAARALAGWVVEEGEVEWRRENAFVAPLLFRGVQDEWDTTKVVDHLCDQPETATRVSSRLWAELVGTELERGPAGELGKWWQDRELSVMDLLERILLDPAMAAGRLNRPRGGLEWYTAFRSATGLSDDDPWSLKALGQMPYLPPNVGGWPTGPRWLSPGSVLARASLAFNLDPAQLTRGRSGTTAEILDRCGLHEVSAATQEALDSVRSSDALSPEAAYHSKWRLALSSPEFNLS